MSGSAPSRDDLDLRARAAYSAWSQDGPETMAVDTETTGLNYHDTPFCVTLAWRKDSGAYVGHYIELTERSLHDVQDMLLDTPELVFHNAKFDLQKLLYVKALLWSEALTPERIHDTEAQAHLLDEHQRLGLKSLATEKLGVETDEAKAIQAARRKLKLTKDDGYDKLPREVIIPYAIQDAILTLRLHHQFYPQVSAHADLLDLYRMEMQLTLALLRMEGNGMAVDVDYLTQTAREYAKRALELEVSIRRMVGRDDFNPNSPKQVLEAFDARGWHNMPSTDADTLKGMDDPLAKAIVELRGVRKMHGTYLQGLLDEQTDGIVHPWFRQHGTRTGRMSSGGATA